MTAAYRLALVGNPNCGKSALFNALTGSRQKVANYPGVTVERKVGRFASASGVVFDVVDLPGSYSLRGRSPDEEITRDVILGRHVDEAAPDVILCVIDATNLRQHLRLVLEVIRQGRPVVVALNMMDLAAHRDIEIDIDGLSKELGVPVVETVAVRKAGLQNLLDHLSADMPDYIKASTSEPAAWQELDVQGVRQIHAQAKRIANAVTLRQGGIHQMTQDIDAIVLHPVMGPGILLIVLFLMFQAVFSGAEAPMGWIDDGVVHLQEFLRQWLPPGHLQSLLLDGILSGVGSVIIFLPQIVILFTFILLLEASGYMVRAAFLMDNLMGRVGLNGRSFIPLLSSFACAIPGIMATRTIENPRDRLTTILVAPLMTCSARLPVYTLIIAAFIPNYTVGAGVGLQGLVMLGLYVAGIVSALIIAGVLKLTVTKGTVQPLLMEMPTYKVPAIRDIILGVWQRAKVFLRRAGTIILGSMIVLWVLATFPAPPPDADLPAIYYSFAGIIGQFLEPLFAPIGFGWEIVIALIPGMAAREVAVAALGTVYALSGTDEAIGQSLSLTLQTAWSLPTGLSFLVWYIFAPQCLATIAATRRETNSWTWPSFMFVYLITLAYLASLITYRVASIWL